VTHSHGKTMRVKGAAAARQAMSTMYVGNPGTWLLISH